MSVKHLLLRAIGVAQSVVVLATSVQPATMALGASTPAQVVRAQFAAVTVLVMMGCTALAHAHASTTRSGGSGRDSRVPCASRRSTAYLAIRTAHVARKERATLEP